jgi:hypothetical protein
MKRTLALFALFAAVAVPSWGQAGMSSDTPLDFAKLDSPKAYCRCGSAVRTPTASVAGVNCGSATASLESFLWGYISCVDCREPVLTSSCSFSGGEDPIIFASGYLTYRCYQLGGCQIP